MLSKIDKQIDTSDWETFYYGKGTAVKVEHTTTFRTVEAMLIRELSKRRRFDDNYIPPYNIIGDTNLVIKNNKLVITEKALLQLNRTEFKENDLFINFSLYHTLNPKLKGYKKYGSGLYMRPILITKSDQVTSASDIIDIAGMQLLSRDNQDHNQLKPILVRGIRRVKTT